MQLREILAVPRIDVSLAVPDKEAALAAMAQLLCKGEGAASDPVTLTRVLGERESLGSTGVGSGVAIPHGRVAGLDHFVGALAISRRGIPFQSIDGEPVDVLFALVGPERASGEHLKCLARIGRLLRDPGIRRCLRESADPAEALALVLAADVSS
jgi:PTS system nitrogen regulatory IIA component